MWSEHIIRSSVPGVPSLRSKLCQVFSSSQERWCCRLCPWATLIEPGLGYIDKAGVVTLAVALDMDPCLDVKIITKENITENKSKSLFNQNQSFKELKLPKNYRYL